MIRAYAETHDEDDAASYSETLWERYCVSGKLESGERGMDIDLRLHVGEIYDGAAWEAVTGVLWNNGVPFQLFKFEQDVDYDGARWRCVIIQKCVYDRDDVSAVDYAEDVFAEAWTI